MNSETIINIGHTQIEKREDDIVEIRASNRMYSAQDIKEIHKAVDEINNKNKALLLLIAADFTSVEPSARHFLSTPEAGNHSIAEAYVIKSLAQRLLLNFLIRVNGTPVPAKFFTDVKDAEDWLRSFQKMNSENKESKILQSMF